VILALDVVWITAHDQPDTRIAWNGARESTAWLTAPY